MQNKLFQIIMDTYCQLIHFFYKFLWFESFHIDTSSAIVNVKICVKNQTGQQLYLSFEQSFVVKVYYSSSNNLIYSMVKKKRTHDRTKIIKASLHAFLVFYRRWKLNGSLLHTYVQENISLKYQLYTSLKNAYYSGGRTV